MAMMRSAKVTVLSLCVLACMATASEQAANKKKSSTKIEYYQQDNVTNRIPYFDHRFRIDAELDEVTMIFYHSAGAKPIILVRPDGSKLRVNKYDKENVEWYDDRTYDMIRIKKPMPGPWQALGDILPSSEILVVSDVRIVVPPLPEIMLSGETIKIEGKLVNGDEPISNPLFRDVVQLDVEFVSSNNSAYENFGADNVNLTTFRDDGRALDEYANDGIFTGEFHLAMAAGEWVPIYKVDMPMAKRELKQKPVMIRKTPVSISVDIAKHEHEFHRVHFAIDPTYVDPNSIIFQGKITFPDKQSQPFSIMEGEGLTAGEDKQKAGPNERIKDFGYTEPGIHRINVSIFGKTINGREFRLIVPEYTFNVERGTPGAAEEQEATGDKQKLDLAAREQELQQQLLAAQQAQQQAIEQQQSERLMMIAIGNISVLVIAILAFFFMRFKRKKSAK